MYSNEKKISIYIFLIFRKNKTFRITNLEKHLLQSIMYLRPNVNIIDILCYIIDLCSDSYSLRIVIGNKVVGHVILLYQILWKCILHPIYT